MIVKMKRVHIITLETLKEDTVRQVRKLGLMHVETLSRNSDNYQLLKEKKDLLEKSLYLIPKPKKKKPSSAQAEATCGYKIASSVIEHYNRLKALQEERERLYIEMERMGSWGHFNPEDMHYLSSRGVELTLFKVPVRFVRNIPDTVDYIVISRDRQNVLIVAAGKPDEESMPVPQSALPARSLSAMQSELVELNRQIKECQDIMEGYHDQTGNIKKSMEDYNRQIEYEEVKSGVVNREKIAWLSGYIPADKTDIVRESARTNGWGLILNDPSPEEPVPTLIRNPRAIRIIKPVFDLLGTVPGYREYDISPWFLFFFSIFYAMIVGDAGYGFLMLLGTIIARIKLKKVPSDPFILMTVMSVSTIIWGAMTGTWFAIEAVSKMPPFSWLVIPYIANFADPASGINTTTVLMKVCFSIAIVHLTLAHLVSFFKNFPKLTSFAEIGKILVLAGFYMLIFNMIFQEELFANMVQVLIICLISGVGLLVIFSEQNGNFIKGVLIGLLKLPLTLLNSMGSFGDIISYVRLFAVGFAGFAVERAFNSMAAQLSAGNPHLIVFSVLILLAGHSLNIIMCFMSIVVHGVRLNMLEFSSHLGMEWSGTEYAPFSEKK
ncbi:MAG: hypothetical protein JW969_07610 [Spirochaetales bacterium]|nr:hypothetical protein [Spirochaetales bacterium]